MPSDHIIELIRQGGVSIANVRPELPPIDPAELKVIAFEHRAKSLNSAVNGMSATIRDELIPKRRDQIAWLNSLMSDRITQSKGKARGDSREYYLRSEVDRVLLVLAVNEAEIASLEAERDRLIAEWKPLKQLADGMRAELTKVQQQQREIAARSRPLPEKDPTAIAAEMQYQRGGGPTDDLRGSATVTAGGATFAGDPNWLERIQATAYGKSDER